MKIVDNYRNDALNQMQNQNKFPANMSVPTEIILEVNRLHRLKSLLIFFLLIKNSYIADFLTNAAKLEPTAVFMTSV